MTKAEMYVFANLSSFKDIAISLPPIRVFFTAPLYNIHSIILVIECVVFAGLQRILSIPY